jgi:hypothetical protein
MTIILTLAFGIDEPELSAQEIDRQIEKLEQQLCSGDSPAQ